MSLSELSDLAQIATAILVLGGAAWVFARWAWRVSAELFSFVKRVRISVWVEPK